MFRKGSIVLVALLFFGVAAGLAYRTNIQRHESLQRPCLSGGSDQFDYNNMAYVFSRFNLIGVLNTSEYRVPFLAFEKETPFELTRKERENLEKRILAPPLGDGKRPIPYAYRAWTYPIMLGTAYKLFGYDFVVARSLNIVLFGLVAALAFLLAHRLGGLIAGIVAGIIVVSVPRLLMWNPYLLTETPAALMVLCAAGMLCCLAASPRKAEWFFLSGIALALLVVTKKLFLGSTGLVVLILLFVLLREFSWSAVKRFVMLGVGLAVVLGPWAAYNVAVTRHVSLFMGTNGWHDMPASYSPEFLEKPGLKDFFERRERIFKAYEAEHGVQVRGDIRRALVGKEIWKEMMADPEIARLAPRLFIKKVVDELHALPSEWAVRVMAFVGIITLGARRLETWFLLAIPVGALVMIGLVHGDEGRLFSPCFPIVSIFAGIGMAGIVNGVVQAIRGQARTPASTPAIEKPSAPAG